MSLIVLKELKSQKSEEIFANYYFFGSACTLQNTIVWNNLTWL
jgi:hypothetical protein